MKSAEQASALVHLDHDATAFYDRIILPMVSLISRAHGQHHSIVLINAITLKSARYLLKTQLGISTTSYSHCDLFLIYGSRQGSGNSPGLQQSHFPPDQNWMEAIVCW